MKNKRSIGLLMVAMAALFWGSMGITIRNLNEFQLDPFSISFFRTAIAFIFYLIFFGRKDKSVLKIDGRGLVFCAVYGILSFGLAFVAYNIAVSRIPIAVATVLMFTSPVWVIIFSKIFFREKLTARKGVAISLSLMGCFLISKGYKLDNLDMDLLGILFAIVAGITFALQVVMPKFVEDRYSKDSLLIYGFLFASIFLLFFMDFANTSHVLQGGDLHGMALNLLVLGVVNTVIPNAAYVKSTEYVEASTGSIIISMEPLVAAVLAYLTFGEVLEGMQVAGMGIILVSMGVLNINFKRKKAAAQLS